MKISVPIQNLDNLRILCKHNVDEVYFGYLSSQWEERGVFTDKSNRRHGVNENITCYKELKEVVLYAKEHNTKTSLAINNSFSKKDFDLAEAQAGLAIDLGVDTLIISDLGLLSAISKKHIKFPEICVSILSPILNWRAVKIFNNFNITRIILPRYLCLSDVKKITSMYPEIEFGQIFLNDGCHFTDGLCGFYHKANKSRITKGIKQSFNIQEMIPVKYIAQVSKFQNFLQCCFGDTNFSIIERGVTGNKERLKEYYRKWYTHKRIVYRCGLCSLFDFRDLRISWIKVAGRSYSIKKKENDVKMIKEAMHYLCHSKCYEEYVALCQNLFKKYNGFPCQKKYCYFCVAD